MSLRRYIMASHRLSETWTVLTEMMRKQSNYLNRWLSGKQDLLVVALVDQDLRPSKKYKTDEGKGLSTEYSLQNSDAPVIRGLTGAVGCAIAAPERFH